MKKTLFLLLLIQGLLLVQTLDATITFPNLNIEAGTTFMVDVQTSQLLVGDNITAYQFDLTFDESVINYVGYHITGTISSGGMVAVNDMGSTIALGFMTTVPLTGSGTLLQLEFSATGALGSTSILDGSDFLYNTTPVPDIVDGSVSISESTSQTITFPNVNVETGSTFMVDVQTSQLLAGDNITAYQFNLAFDESVIDYVGYHIIGTISSDGIVAVNDMGSTIVLGFMATAPLTGSGTLVHLEFSAAGAFGSTSILDGSDFLYNATPVPDVADGSVSIDSNEAPYFDFLGTIYQSGDIVLVTTDEDIEFIENLTAIDANPNQNFTWSVFNITHGVVQISDPPTDDPTIETKQITFTPDADYNGQAAFIIEVSDNITDAISSVIFAVTVNPVNDPPVLLSFAPDELAFTVEEDSVVVFQVEAEDIDSTLEYEWYVNDELQPELTNLFEHSFDVVGEVEIKSIITDGEYNIETIWMVTVEPGSGIGNGLEVHTALQHCCPNPFNPSTTIFYSLESNDQMTLEIFNSRGQKIRSLIEGTQNAGEHSVVWEGKDDTGDSVSSGIYFYRMKTSDTDQIKKMVLLK